VEGDKFMTKISPKEFNEKLNGGNCILVDVRSLDEHKAAKISGSQCIPLDEIKAQDTKLPGNKEILLYCRSGKRSNEAFETLRKKGFENLKQLDGGIIAWENEGLNVHKNKAFGMSIQRQVLAIVGLLVLTFSLLTMFYSSSFIYLIAAIGFALMIAGLTGFCGMALLLEKMPWNKEAVTCSLN
jgi:rhodanese-related sulfurtransferase